MEVRLEAVGQQGDRLLQRTGSTAGPGLGQRDAEVSGGRALLPAPPVAPCGGADASRPCSRAGSAGPADRELMLAPARPSRVSDLAAATAADHLCSLMAGLVSDRHLIQAIHRPDPETLTPMTGAGTCDDSGQAALPHLWRLSQHWGYQDSR